MSDEDDESNTNTSAEDAIESLDDAFDNPTPLDRFIASIEEDLSSRTPPRRNLAGQIKRMVLRGGISIFAALGSAIFVGFLAWLLGYQQTIIFQIVSGVFVAIGSLVYGFMLTDWLPRKPNG